jgi:hypothetical protein
MRVEVRKQIVEKHLDILPLLKRNINIVVRVIEKGVQSQDDISRRASVARTCVENPERERGRSYDDR